MDIVIKRTDSEEATAEKLKEFVRQQSHKAKIHEDAIFGILKDSEIDPLAFQKAIRDEWE